MIIQYVHMPVKTKKWQKTKKHKNKPSTEQATNSMHKIKQQKKKTVAGQKKTHYIHISIKKNKKAKNKPSNEQRATNSMHKTKQQKKKTVAGQKKAAAATENSSHSKKQKLQHNTVCT